MTTKRVVSLYPAVDGQADPAAAASEAPDPSGAEGAGLSAPEILAAEDALAAAEFEALLHLGRAKGGLTQDDVVSVLESVELSADLISGVVERIREAGIEFTYDTGETTIVPMAVPPADTPRPEPAVHLVAVPPVVAPKKAARKRRVRRRRRRAGSPRATASAARPPTRCTCTSRRSAR